MLSRCYRVEQCQSAVRLPLLAAISEVRLAEGRQGRRAALSYPSNSLFGKEMLGLVTVILTPVVCWRRTGQVAYVFLGIHRRTSKHLNSAPRQTTVDTAAW